MTPTTDKTARLRSAAQACRSAKEVLDLDGQVTPSPQDAALRYLIGAVGDIVLYLSGETLPESTKPKTVYLNVESIRGVCAYGQICELGSKEVLWSTPDAYPWESYDSPLAAARREALKRGWTITELDS